MEISDIKWNSCNSELLNVIKNRLEVKVFNAVISTFVSFPQFVIDHDAFAKSLAAEAVSRLKNNNETKENSTESFSLEVSVEIKALTFFDRISGFGLMLFTGVAIALFGRSGLTFKQGPEIDVQVRNTNKKDPSKV